MYFGATEKWHVQMVMVSRVVQLAGADLCYYHQVCIIEESVCSHNQLSMKLACTAQVASVIQPYIVLILIKVLDITG